MEVDLRQPLESAAMAMVRSRSAGDAQGSLEEVVNPWWSERVRQEAQLQTARPRALPPVDDDGASDELVEDPQKKEDLHRRLRQQVRQKWGLGETTLVSGSGLPEGGLLGELTMPVGPGLLQGDPQLRTEGPMPSPENDEEDVEFQKDLEQCLFEHIQDENLKLRQQLHQMQELLKERDESQSSSWEEVKPPKEEQQTSGVWHTPEVMETPKRTTQKQLEQTPNGTRIPDGPPPGSPEVAVGGSRLPPVPPFPWPSDGNYNVDYVNVDLRQAPGLRLQGVQGRQGVHGHRDDYGLCDRVRTPRRGGDNLHHGLPQQDGIQHAGKCDGVGLALVSEKEAMQNEIAALRDLLDKKAAQESWQQNGYWNGSYSPQYPQAPPCPPAEVAIGETLKGYVQSTARPGRALRGEVVGTVANAQQALYGLQGVGCGSAGLGGNPQGFGKGAHSQSQGYGGTPQGFGKGNHSQVQGHGVPPVTGKGAHGGGDQFYSPEATSGKGQDDVDADQHLRGFQIKLPKLVPPTAQNATLEMGDWMVQVRPLIADISSSSIKWWDDVVGEANKVYSVWLQAMPLDRVTIQPNVDCGGRQRLDQRVVALIVVFKLLCIYQPGGLGERAGTLVALTETTSATTPSEAAAALRAWKRQWVRAKELQASLPDPMIQVRSLDKIMATILAKDAQAMFRVSTCNSRLM